MLVRLGFPLGAHQERDRGERHMPDEHDRSVIAVDRADRALIEQAAARLRQGAIRAGYAGMEHKHFAFAFALALVLDELARHVRDLRPEVREQTLRGVRMLLG